MSLNTEKKIIPFARPSIDEEEERAILDVLRSGWLTTASQTAGFEREFAEYVGARHALAVSSATAGLHLSLEALGVKPGDTVVTTPYTFAAGAEIIRYLGADPVFVDIEPDSPNIDPERIQAAIQSINAEHYRRVAAVVPVHIGGEPCSIPDILDICRPLRIPVVEDAAHALPSVTESGTAGCFGETGVYSFYATKTITTGEGGMIVTDDDDIADRIRITRLHGIDRPIWDRYTKPKKRGWEYDIVAVGFKYNMPDLAAALGRTQLRKADRFYRRRKQIADRYRNELSRYDFIELPRDIPGHSYHLFMILLDLTKLDIDRDGFADELASRGIGTSVHYKPLHLMSYYRKRYDLADTDFPNALARYKRTLSLPIYPDLTEEDVTDIIREVTDIGVRHYTANVR